MKISKVHYHDRIKSLPRFEESVLLIDRKLLKIDDFNLWLNQINRPKILLTSGENLKNLESYAKIMGKVIKLTQGMDRQKIQLVSIGGGTIGDFAGFLASTLKRGVDYCHIPSTWLAAVDSAHGGKTALNFGHYKNQIGSFYPASDIYIIKELLFNNPPKRIKEASSEFFKMGLIYGGSFWDQISVKSKKKIENLLWDNLPQSNQAKIHYVKKDPYETKGIRKVLNLGHTWGHIIEGLYHYSHGYSVGQGLIFALEMSREKKILSSSEFDYYLKVLNHHQIIKKQVPLMSLQVFKKMIKQDKKIINQSDVDFVYLKRVGKPIVKKTPILEIYQILHKYHWFQS